MLATIATLLAMNSAPGSACTGAAPAITSVATSQSSNGGGLNTYTVNVTVTNDGAANQPGNVLQSVAVYLDGMKKDQKGIPPLRAGQAYTFPYLVHRNADARVGSTSVRFKLVMDRPAQGGPQECLSENASRRITL